MKYSFIVPVYNGSEFIRRCLDSIQNQTFKDFECIVLDDCSTDNTEEIAMQYAANDDRFVVIGSEENCGVGYTRKKGVKLSKGEFIIFIDSDDLLLPDFLDIVDELQKQNDSDVVYTSPRIFYPEHYYSKDNDKAADRLLGESATVQPHFDAALKFLTGKAFRRNLFDKVEMSEKRVGEDVQTLFYLCYVAEKVRETSYHGYVHIFRKGSLLAAAPFETCFIGSGLAEIEMIEYLLDKDDKDIAYYILCQLYINFLKVRALVKRGDKAVDKEFLRSTLDGGWGVLTKWIEDNIDICVESVKHYAQLATEMKKTDRPDTWISNQEIQNL